MKNKTVSAPVVRIVMRHLASAINRPCPLSCDERNKIAVATPNEIIAKVSRKPSVKGNVESIIYKLIGGLRSSMGYLGSKNLTKLRIKPNFVKITKAGFYESMVHNVDMVKNDSKY